jgi:hypothetical protein
MDYAELVAKVIELLQREKRVPYRALKRRFDLDDDYIEDLKVDLIQLFHQWYFSSDIDDPLYHTPCCVSQRLPYCAT